MSIRNINRLIVQFSGRPYAGRQCSVRLYSRWTHRKPSKVLMPFEPPEKVELKKEKIIALDPALLKNSQPNKTEVLKHNENDIPITNDPDKGTTITLEKSKDIKRKRDEKLKKTKFYLSQQKVFDDDGEIMFEKCKDNDGRISSLLTSVKSKKDRVRSQQILVEGWRLIVDGLEAKCNLKYVIFSRAESLNNLRPFLPKTGVKFFKIPYKEISLWSDVETPSGTFGVFEMPTEESIKRLSTPLPLDLVCDNIRVPGNLGAILRAAVGAGCDKVLLSKGCVDIWDPKVVRSAAGAHFRLPIQYSIDWEEIHKQLDPNTSLFLADSNARLDDDLEVGDMSSTMGLPVLPYYAVQYSTMKHITLIIGGETEGISDESYQLAASKNGLRLNIPMARGVDSLNSGMAAAIITFEIRKQLIQAWTKIKLDRQAGAAT